MSQRNIIWEVQKSLVSIVEKTGMLEHEQLSALQCVASLTSYHLLQTMVTTSSAAKVHQV